MKFSSKRVVVAAFTAAWMIAVGIAASGRGPLVQAVLASVLRPSAAPTETFKPGDAVPIAMKGAFQAAQQTAAVTGYTKELSENVFKNIQVLKGIPVDEFMGTMGVFTTSLSLCCGNCHTGAGTSNPKWEDDPPRKKVARNMIKMVQMINETNFGGRQVVTCWTCHRGQLSPAVTTPLDFAYGESMPVPPDILPRATSGGPTLDQVFARYIDALGGQAATDNLTSYVAKGTSALFGEVEANPAELYAKATGQSATYVHQKEGDVVRAFDGTTAWWQIPLTITPQYSLNSTLLEGARFDAAMMFPWKIRGFFTNWRVSYPTTIEDTEVDVVQGQTQAGMIGTLYFDKKTGLLKRYIRYSRTMVGRIATQVDYGDYRPVAGVKMPFKFGYAWVSERDDWTLTSYEPNATIDAAKFGRPDPKTAGGDPNARK